MTNVDSMINAEEITVFSKSQCPFCVRAKDMLNTNQGNKVKITVYELDKMSDGAEIQNKLKDKTGQRTVPNIFIKGKHVGGCDESMALHSAGKIAGML